MKLHHPIQPNDQLEVYVLAVFHRAEHTIRSHEGLVIKAHGLTPTQFGVLDVLYTKGPLAIGTLIGEMLSTSGNMTVVIRNMERDGYVYRRANPEDGRSSLIDLTEMGRRKLEEILPEHVAHTRKIFSVLTDQEKYELIRILRKIQNPRAEII